MTDATEAERLVVPCTNLVLAGLAITGAETSP